MIQENAKQLVHKPTNSMTISTGVVFPIESLIIFSS